MLCQFDIIMQALIDMESDYFGIKSPTVEIEMYDSNSSRDGYYNKKIRRN